MLKMRICVNRLFISYSNRNNRTYSISVIFVSFMQKKSIW